MRFEYTIHPRQIGIILGALSLYFAAQSLVAEYLIENVLNSERYRSLILTIDLFSVNAESTIPTWYSTILLLIAAVLLAVIATVKHRRAEPYARHWIGLALIFLYLSIDEGAAIHEILADALQTDLNLTGYLTFAWQVVAAPLVIVIGLLYIRFVLHLPPRTRNLFILAGTLYVGGALIVEGVSANRLYVDGEITFAYLAIATIEELFEMLGAVIFIYALLSYAAAMDYTLIFRPQSSAQAADEPVLSAPKYKRVIILAALLIIGLNVALVGWALQQSTASEPVVEDSAVIQAVMGELVTDDVAVTLLPGRFGPGSDVSQQVAAALLTRFDEVMVIIFPASEASIAIASDEMPFDRDSLVNLLHSYGLTQFVIMDTRAVRAITAQFSDAG